jgi:hypothetical protein
MPFHYLLRIVLALAAMALAGGPARPLARAAAPVRSAPTLHGGSVGIGIMIAIPGYLD